MFRGSSNNKMTQKTSALERKLIGQGLELIGGFKGFQIWAKGDRRALYDIEKREALPYHKDDDICKYINMWSKIKGK